MTWVKIDDQFTDHPKIVAAGPLAGWLYVAGLCYSARYLTDGFIPRAQVRKLVDVDEVTPLVTALVTAGLWRESQGGYAIHHYLEYNPPAEKVKAERAANAKRQAKYKETRRNGGEASIYNAVSNGVSNAASNGVTTAVPSPSPSPSTSSLRSEVVSSAPQADAPTRSVPKPPKGTRLTEPYVPDEDDQQWVRSRYPASLDWQYETEKFNDYWSSQPGQKGVKTHWRGTWRNWMRSAWERGPQSNGKARLQAVPQPRSPDEVLEEQRARDREDAEWRASKVRDGKADRLCIQRHKQDVERGVYPRLEVQA